MNSDYGWVDKLVCPQQNKNGKMMPILMQLLNN